MYTTITTQAQILDTFTREIEEIRALGARPTMAECDALIDLRIAVDQLRAAVFDLDADLATRPPLNPARIRQLAAQSREGDTMSDAQIRAIAQVLSGASHDDRMEQPA